MTEFSRTVSGIELVRSFSKLAESFCKYNLIKKAGERRRRRVIARFYFGLQHCLEDQIRSVYDKHKLCGYFDRVPGQSGSTYFINNQCVFRRAIEQEGRCGGELYRMHGKLDHSAKINEPNRRINTMQCRNSTLNCIKSKSLLLFPFIEFLSKYECFSPSSPLNLSNEKIKKFPIIENE